MKFLAAALAVFLILPGTAMAIGRPLVVPPVPYEKEQIAIVLLKEPKTESQIKALLSSYPGLQLRHIFSEALYGFSVKGDAETIGKLSFKEDIMKISPAYSYQADMEENIKMIGGEAVRGYFDKLDRRLTGKGITVGVIDTGLDYTHPDLRNNYSGGHDLVDGDADPMETKVQQGLPTIHGTHVAGIIAANGKIKGVAPEAKIIAYRALGPGGSGTTEQILSAIEQAIKDKVDVLNLSLGNEINGPDLPISLALNKAVDKGIVAVAASGNSGPNVWSVGSPGTASKAISVGASTPIMNIPFLLIEGTSEKIRLEPMAGSGQWDTSRSMELTVAGMGKKVELSDAKNKFVLIKRGSTTFTKKAKNAQNAGAKGVVIYNNTNGSFIGNLEEALHIPVVSVSKKTGEFLKKQIELGNNSIRISMEEEQDRLAAFSSRGPVTGTWEIKPDVVAPGVAINSTIPGGYMALQGTSMAAPHVAGACALIRQAHPDWSPLEVKAALMNTAKPISKGIQKPYRTYEQGAGRVQILEAVQAASLVLPASLHFGKFGTSGLSDQSEAVLTIENKSLKTRTYSFRMPEAEEGLDWQLPLSFTLNPGESRRVKVGLRVDEILSRKKIYDGRLELEDGTNVIGIPYLYVVEEPGYPRVMGFDLTQGDKPGTFRYEVYLPGGADEFGIALFNPEDYRFVGFLDISRNLKRGMIQKEIAAEMIPEEGRYLAKVFAKKANQEDYIETELIFPEKEEIGRN
ncbi:S8 family serine peptidase [Neobacillus terrae]|uniref:S8 family serine peptidase n=1 Tax=Neobacillus terrae TaxID=3034837 RepID=UPI00140864DE|nr:S8 family serine peptidase [Neobacillus terrae]NHM30093.1 S8 family serine peptidase [Neobacillus terrae]